ncbi:MAG: hypothetical protein Q8P54_01320 [bacterium]|nr:hypothetical protein [bacterium]
MPTDKNVSVVREGFLFNDVMGMPFLDTTDGKHIVGVEAIRGYLVTKD